MQLTNRVQKHKSLQPSLTLTREVYAALSPLDQIAAQALEKCGLVQIVDHIEEMSTR
jgi:hypothetical protein